VSIESVSGAGIKAVPLIDSLRNTATVDNLAQNQPRRPVLTVVLDKMDIMQSVAPPKPKAKGKTTLIQTVDEPTEVHESVNAVTSLAHGPAQADASAPNSGCSSANVQHASGTHVHGIPDMWANVMYLAPEENGEQGRKLRLVCGSLLIIFVTFSSHNIRLSPLLLSPHLIASANA
jgi:hypothetical protein